MLDAFFLPAENADSKQLTLVLHGLGDSARGYAWLPPALALPDMNYVLVNAPDPYFTGFSWYDYDGDQKPGVVRSREALFELIEAYIQKGHRIEEMFLFGFSQGCLMTLDVGARFPGRFAGLIGISGKVFELENLIDDASPVGREQRFLVTHGDSDPVIPIETTRPQIQALQGAGFQIDWQEFEKQHGFAEPEELDAIRDFIVSRQSESPAD
ncbi:MAG: alpha/beta hydrolase [Verrucomicrobiia bacterium]|jgi:phospholipase/carboxylesterase